MANGSSTDLPERNCRRDPLLLLREVRYSRPVRLCGASDIPAKLPRLASDATTHAKAGHIGDAKVGVAQHQFEMVLATRAKAAAYRYVLRLLYAPSMLSSRRR